ncbi:MAG: anaerobic ribonucleoside-triphosphate reductase activating protein [Clostridia bacterium]|nr:anaerobic ribonucleoside-triphosphate reductase activating protein [Clostridia bacterium]
MKIHGFQKLTLLDYPGHTACTVFLAGCDLRCPYCHNAGLLDASASPLMDDSELIAFLRKRKGLLDGVAFTGGEPLLHRELPEVMEKIRSMGYRIKLDTNGLHPEALKTVLDGGLADYAAMDIKNSRDKYAASSGVSTVDLSRIDRSITLIMDRAPDYEFRTTVVDQLHDEDSFRDIGPWIRGAGRYFLQAFTDRDSVPFRGFTAPTAEQMEKYASIVRPFVGEVSLRGL